MNYELTRAVLSALEREGVKYVVFGAVALALRSRTPTQIATAGKRRTSGRSRNASARRRRGRSGSSCRDMQWTQATAGQRGLDVLGDADPGNGYLADGLARSVLTDR